MGLLRETTTLVERAGAIALEHYGRARVDVKDDQSVVTAADREVEAFLREGLGRLLPEAAYVGEETEQDASALRAAVGSEWTWIVDPIDGTAGFTDQIDTFCVSVGLFHNGAPHTGAIHFPATGHWFTAEKGEGAVYDGRAASVLSALPVLDRAVVYVDAKSHLKYRIQYAGKTRSLGSTAYHVLLVARGVAVGALSTAHIWDYAGAAAVLAEAGGVIRHLDGTAIDWRAWLDGRNLFPPVLAAPPALWDEVAPTIRRLPDATLAS